MQARGAESLVVFGNESRLGDWSVSVTVTRLRTILDISLNSSHGLILGDLNNVSFSFFLPAPGARSLVSSPLASLPPAPLVTVCLRVVRGRASCQSTPLTHREEPRSGTRGSTDDIEVQTIPVLWHQDPGQAQEAK